MRGLLAERDEARGARDFARADALRDEIGRLGFEVRDTAAGGEAIARARFETLDPASVPSMLGEPATLDFSIHLLYEGFPEDVEGFVARMEGNARQHVFEILLVDPASGDGGRLEDMARAHPALTALHLDRDPGWAAARNAGLRRSRGRLVVVADASLRPEGDILAPLADALRDPSVGIAGPFGLTTRDLHEFEESSGSEVDAIEGYLLALRRELLGTIRFDERFRWYRHADIDLSFQVRAVGLRAVIAPCPVARGPHRGWDALDPEERARRSKRNFYRFLDRWRDRRDLLRGG